MKLIVAIGIALLATVAPALANGCAFSTVIGSDLRIFNACSRPIVAVWHDVYGDHQTYINAGGNQIVDAGSNFWIKGDY